MRYFLNLSYNGTNYHGWQKQLNSLSIQEIVESKLKILLKHEVETVASGRTDTGVHALEQFIHFDTPLVIDSTAFVRKLNAILPVEISANNIFQVRDTASARYDARKRSYIYKVSLRKNPFVNQTAHLLYAKPDIEKMNLAAQMLIKYEDFQAFSKVKTGVTHFRCQIFEAYWVDNDNLIVFHITANRFLRGMVRCIVGSILDVGMNKTTIEKFCENIENKNRNFTGSSVPAKGLFLSKVQFSNNLFI